MDTKSGINIRLPYNIVLSDRQVTIDDFKKESDNGLVKTNKSMNDTFLFRIYGTDIAKGKIIKKDEEYFFKIEKII